MGIFFSSEEWKKDFLQIQLGELQASPSVSLEEELSSSKDTEFCPMVITEES